MQDNTVWLNQEQLVKLYNSSNSNISEHIKHIFEEKELDVYYNLDMIVIIESIV